MTQAIEDYHFLRLNEELLKNPYPFYQLLRENAPVFREPDFGVFLVSRYDDIVEVNRQPEVFSSVLVANAPYVDLPCPVDELPAWRAANPYGDKILSNDPPDHTRHKRMINRFFTPKRVADLEPRIRETRTRSSTSSSTAGRSRLSTVSPVRIPRASHAGSSASTRRSGPRSRCGPNG